MKIILSVVSVIIIGVIGLYFFTVGSNKKNGGQIIADDRNIEFYMSNMRSITEVYLDENNFSYSGLCSYDQIVSYLEEIAKKNKDGKSGMVCSDSAEAYAISSSLNNGKYICIDNTGVIKKDAASLHTGISCTNSASI